jgi:hypothetical protein
MEAGCAVELRATTVADFAWAEPAMHAAAQRVIARTRLAWAAPVPDVSTRRDVRPRMELKASRALDNQPCTGD